MSEKAYLSGFACSCGDENEAKVAEMRQRVIDFHQKGDDWNWSKDHEIDILVMDMLHRWGATVTGIPSDQWSAVEMKTEWTDPPTTVWAECDRIVDGFYLAWDLLHEYFGDQLPYPNHDRD